jgi:hypothetical protein
MGISISVISGIIIIIVAIITLIRIIKPILEGLVVVILVIIGSALIFHTSPTIGIPGTSFQVHVGLAIIGVTPTPEGNIVLLFNSYPFAVTNFIAMVNNQSVAVLNSQASIPPGIGALLLNTTQKGEIKIVGSINFYGVTLGTAPAVYNYT